ncbi:hypothetical protein N9X77_06505 [Luminiphilus sp.]|nr:hypothetical protein [Luminiphilus sp.]
MGILFLPIIGMLGAAVLKGNDSYYIFNESRLILVFSAIAFVGRHECTLDNSIWSVIVIAIIAIVGLTRGLNGAVMPIYAGVIAYLFYSEVFRKLKGIPALFLGSGSAGLGVLSASLAGAGRGTTFSSKVVTMLVALFALLGLIYYQVAVRGRAIEFGSIDRLVLFYEGLRIFVNAEWHQILFGFGPGFDFYDHIRLSDAPVIVWLLNSIGREGVYSHLFHSDFLRLLLNYGLLLLFYFYYLLYKFLRYDLFILIAICGFFNPVLLTPSIGLALVMRALLCR